MRSRIKIMMTLSLILVAAIITTYLAEEGLALWRSSKDLPFLDNGADNRLTRIAYIDLVKDTMRSKLNPLIGLIKEKGLIIVKVDLSNVLSINSDLRNVQGILIHIDKHSLESLEYNENGPKIKKIIKIATKENIPIILYSEKGMSKHILVKAIKYLIDEKELVSKLLIALNAKDYKVKILENGTRIKILDNTSKKLYVFGFKVRSLTNNSKGISLCLLNSETYIPPIRIINFITYCLNEVSK